MGHIQFCPAQQGERFRRFQITYCRRQQVLCSLIEEYRTVDHPLASQLWLPLYKSFVHFETSLVKIQGQFYRWVGDILNATGQCFAGHGWDDRHYPFEGRHPRESVLDNHNLQLDCICLGGSAHSFEPNENQYEVGYLTQGSEAAPVISVF